MIRVNRASFFATVGQLNVHPCIDGPWDDARGYQSDWKLHGGAGKRVGMSYGLGDKTEYFVEPDFYAANAAAIETLKGN